MATLTLEHVTKTFPGNVRAVDDLSLDVAGGELLVLFGPSGCGKTTTLRLIAGLEDVTRGTISMDGRVINRLRPKDRDVAMVFQSRALFPHLSVAETNQEGGNRTPRCGSGRPAGDRPLAHQTARRTLRRRAATGGARSGDRP